MLKSNKNKRALSLGLSTILALGGIFATANNAHAANISEDKKVQLENAYFDNSVANQASRMLLEQSPKTTAAVKDQLEALIKKSDDQLAKNKKVVESLRPERANEAQQTKDLAEATMKNRVQQEAVFLLFDLSPNSVAGVADKLESQLNKSIQKTSQAEYQLNKLRGVKEVKIIHYNDIHGRVEENEKNGELGMAKIKTFYDYKNTANNAILLDAGDTTHGTTFATISEGDSVIDTMNVMGITAMTAGNHDFNYGYKRLMDLNKKANFPIMGTNVVDQNGNPILDTGKIIDVDGTKVGIFGLSTSETKVKSSPVNTEGLTFADSVETAKKEVARLKAEGAQVIVCLAHLGVGEESTDTSKRVADNVDGIDVIIDGHSHTQLDNGLMEKSTLVAQTGAHGYNLGEVTLLVNPDGTVKSKTSKLHPYKRMKHLYANKAAMDVINKVTGENDKILKQEVGKTDVTLDGAREDVRTRETNLGDFVADAMKDAIKADVAITNGGGIRDKIDAGTITKGDVLTVFPFTNFLVKIEVTGADIKAALEHGLTDAPNQAGKFPQIAGMTVKYDSSKPAGSRVTEVLVNGQALDMNKKYQLATNDFMAIGGDGYTMFEGKTRTEERGLISDIFEEAIKAKGTIGPKTDGRMTDVNGK